jgi:hypothetical protein
MKLELQVCTLEQAQRLYDLGIEQTGNAFNWIFDSGMKWKLFPDGYYNLEEEGIEVFAAYTVAELGVMLPYGYVTVIDEHINGDRCFTNWHYEGDDLEIATGAKDAFGTEAEARAALLIHLLETGKTTAEEVNNRLHQQQYLRTV